MSTGLIGLLEHPVVSRLLSLDVTFHGEIVASSLSGMSPVEFWDEGGAAVISAALCMEPYIEREVHSLLSSRKVTETPSHRQLCMSLKCDDHTMNLKLYLWKAGAHTIHPMLNIDLLFLNRSGLQIGNGEYTRRMPIPLFEIMKQCEHKIYQILPDAVPDDARLVERMHDLKGRGWLPKGTRVNFCLKEPEDPKCSICHEIMTAENSVVTECGHTFHEKCWILHLDHTIGDETRRVPPVEVGVFSFGTQMAVYLSCPMCRHQMRSIHCFPGEH
mgnify:CR=1 FL=1